MSIELPDFERLDEMWWEKGQDLIMDNFDKANFEIVKDGTLKVGDLILMNILSTTVNHMAVYIGKDQIFHQTKNRLSSREIYGGYYKKNSRMVLRQK